MQEAFAGSGRTKYDIVRAIAEEFPELALRLPERRNLWSPEDQQMNIFDAMSSSLHFLLCVDVMAAW